MITPILAHGGELLYMFDAAITAGTVIATAAVGLSLFIGGISAIFSKKRKLGVGLIIFGFAFGIAAILMILDFVRHPKPQ